MTAADPFLWVGSGTEGSNLSPDLSFSSGSHSTAGKSEADIKGRDKFASAAVQSEDRRKRQLRSDPEGAPPETRRRLEEMRHTEESVSVSSELATDSEGEGEEEEEAEWEQGGTSDRMKPEEGGAAGKPTRGADTPTGGERASRVHNGRAVIQHLKSIVAPSALAGSPGIKTEHDALSSGGRWAPPTQTSQPQPSHAHTPSSSLNGDSPPTPIPDSASANEAAPKVLFTPPSPALSPTMSVSSPLPRDERAVSGVVSRSGGGAGAGSGPDFELLQRLAAGGAAGRVLFHPLALSPQGPQSLYAPSTIRYAPPELPPSHHHGAGHGEGLQLRSDHHKGPPPAFFPHLQRLAGLPPFSGFSPSDSPFSSSLPFCMNGLRGAAGPEED